MAAVWVHTVAVHEQQGFEPHHFEARTMEQAAAGGALDGGEPGDAPPVVGQQKAHPSAAQQAVGIEDDDHDAPDESIRRVPA